MVLELTDPRWTDFVATHPAATPFHHPDWTRLIADCYGFRGFALGTRDSAGTIRAGMPMVEVRHLGTGPKWVSLPYTDYCPPLASSEEERKELAVTLEQASHAAGVRRVEVRAALLGCSTSDASAFRHVIPLRDNPVDVFAGFRRYQMTNVRGAQREGLSVRQATRPEDLVDTFYRLHLLTRRRIGAPVQPRRFFRLLWEDVISTGLGSVLIVEASARPVAVGVFLTWNGTMIYKFAASDASAWKLHPNHLLTWHAIRSACEGGCRWFDFGRTDFGNEGLRRFKLSWGAVEEPLVYETDGATPEAAQSADGMGTRMLRSVIRRGPLLLCRAVGEALYRYVA